MRNLVLVLFLLTQFPVFGQFENRYWVMGYSNYSVPRYGGSNMDFLYSTPDTASIDRDLNFAGCATSISSPDGRFLFAINGAKIGDSSNHIMQNGDSLICLDGCDPSNDGSYIPQESIIIPDPGDTNQYYVFYNPSEWTGSASIAFNLYYAKVDMRLNSGLGAVTIKNVSVFNDSIQPGQLSACKHGNGHDWWLVIAEQHGPKRTVFLISDSGIQLVSRQQIGNARSVLGYSCFSPDGHQYVSFDMSYGLQLFDFDRCTGAFSSARYVPYVDTIIGAYGIAFSPNSRYLYLSNTNYIYQYDTQVANLSQSKTLIGIWDGAFEDSWLSTQFFYMALARDGKIYMTTGSSTHSFHRIEFPDLPGVSCHFQQRYVTTPRIYYHSIPNHPNFQLGPDLTSWCSGQSISESDQRSFSFKIFPNPSLPGSVSIEYNHVGAEQGRVDITDMEGRMISSSETSSYTSIHEISTKNLPKGIYQVSIHFKDWSACQKLIIL